MASSSSCTAPPPSHHQRVMEKPNQELLQQQQEALKCPRCDSSNTKFCYYNNYSLSQPRHFCKACKRYWTRGGTLRNVPVGGGCRKNKRIKRSINSASSDQTHHNVITAAAIVSSAVSNPPSHVQSHQIDVASTSNHINPLFYGMNIQFPRFNSSSGFDHHHLQPQMNNSSLGLDFTDNIGYRNEFSSNHSLLSSYSSSSIFANSSSTSITTTSSTAPPIMGSLLSSTNLKQQKFINNGGATNNSTFLQGFINNSSSNCTSTEAEMVALKEVKSVFAVEDDNNRFLGVWQNNNQIEHQTGLMSDPSSLYWNTAATALGTTTWNDQTNIGPHQSLLSSDLQ